MTLARPAWHVTRSLTTGFLGDDLFACQPIAEAVQAEAGNFILTCKPSSHRTITEYLYGAKLEEHRETVVKRGKRTTTVYHWLADVPLRGGADALKVNWFSVEMFGLPRASGPTTTVS